MKVNGERLWRQLNAIGGIGAVPEGGVSRFAWSKEYRQACLALMAFAEAYGLTARMDTVGNLFIRMEGRERDLPAVLTGSHLDTVPNGGRFDGVAGVVSSLEALATLRDNGITPKRSLEAVAFINEEATQFLGGTFGSRAVCGTLPEGFVDACREHDTNRSLRDAMVAFHMGLSPEKTEQSKIDPSKYRCFLELHIEQGRHLLDRGDPVAIVTDIAGIQQMYLQLKGVACHAGGMAMKDRHDAMMAAVNIACEVERLALHSGGKDTRATVGYIKATPGVHNIIPEMVEIPIDFREDNDAIWAGYGQSLERFIQAECDKRQLEYSLVKTLALKPAHCAPDIVDTIRSCAQELGIRHSDMVSYPCHDAVNMERIMPMGMIFLRSSNGGLSHCPQEYTLPEDLECGANLLLQTLLRLSE